MQENPYPSSEWNFFQKIAFRFTFIYTLIYFLPFPLNAFYLDNFNFNRLNWFLEKYYSLWKLIIPWVGKQVFKLDITVFPNGSGDTTFNYVQVLCFLVIALFGAFIWTLLDRKRTSYDYLYKWLRVYARFALSSAMILYGAIKVIKSQFPYPSLGKLIDNFGDSSPMGLIWTFMGFSQPYNLFTGTAEMLGGILLAFPQLTTLGALISIGVLSNVFMLNMSYDVPVKLYSFHLLLTAFFLLLPDFKRLTYFFILNNKVEGVFFHRLFEAEKFNKVSKILKVAFLLIVILSSFWGAWQGRTTYGDLAPKVPLYGIWVIDEFEINGEVKPPLLTDETRWKRVVFEFPQTMLLENMPEKKDYVKANISMKNKTIFLSRYRNSQDEKWRANFSFEQIDAETMTWKGLINGEAATLKLHRLDETKFLLNSRGFNWVNEYPYNY